jgi:C4-dicarboxylate-specific signal transduction histidine kinase
MNGTDLRKTGIDVVGDMPWGTHFCLFYETQADLLETLVPYCKAGLESQEFCLWVVAEPLTEEQVTHALERAVPGFDRYWVDQSIEIVAARDWYLQDGTFDLERVIRGWNEKLARASCKGYAGVRVTGDTAWLEKKHWKDFCEYEESLNVAVANQRLAVLCTYPLAACGATEILDVVRTHQFAVAKRRGGWDVVETAGHKQAKAEIKRLNDELEQRVIERTRQLTLANRKLKQQIAERHRAEDALNAARAELAHATRVTVMGEMVASIAHEVTQPLTGIVTNGHACLNWLHSTTPNTTPNMDKAQGAVERMIRDGERANEVIQEIRSLVKKTPPKKTLLNINDLIQKTIALAAGEIAIHQVQLETDLAPALPEIAGDRVQLQQALLNLIVNAIEAMDAVRRRPRRLSIRSERQEEPCGVVVTVQDSGVGLDQHKRNRVFDAFFTTKPQGLGMGLSICRTIISTHGGRLSARSNADHGATFEFTLPARMGEFEPLEPNGGRAALKP